MKTINLIATMLVLTGISVPAQAASLDIIESRLTPSSKTIPVGGFDEDFEANVFVKVMNNHDQAFKITTLSFDVVESDPLDDDFLEDFSFLDLAIKLAGGEMVEIMKTITISAQTLEQNRLLRESFDFDPGDSLEFDLEKLNVDGVKHDIPEPSTILGLIGFLGIGGMLRRKQS